MRTTTILMCLVTAGVISGCGFDPREQFNLRRGAPDEFAVVKRAPLEMPPNLDATEASLPVPAPGSRRPQEKTPSEQAAKAVFGREKTKEGSFSKADAAFLEQAGANEADPTVRAAINEETKELHNRNKHVAERLLSIGGDRHVPSATVIDAEKEKERLSKVLESGEPINAGEIPVVEE
jgi:hypothetical protein